MTIKKYQTLKGLYYQNMQNGDFVHFDTVVKQRQTNELAIHTGMVMSPFKRDYRLPIEYEIFYLPVLQISQLEEQINQLSKEIEQKMAQLPVVAQNQIFISNLIDELQSTNDIEGVRSSREEISQVIEQIQRRKGDRGRFSGLVKQYAKFEENQYSQIREIQDFRNIWNELVSQEVAEQDFPDGKYFRKNGEVIKDGDRVVHRGDANEQQIDHDLQVLVQTMNNDDIPSLAKCFLSHYYYEYIHPFYDGNGRTGRFIVCSYLARKLDRMSAINFSSTIVAHKSTYYKAFTAMADEHNYGEGTGFVISMMRLLMMGQVEVAKKLDHGIQMLDKADQLTEQQHFSDLEQQALFILCQKAIFGRYVGPITDQDLTDIMHISRYRLDQTLAKLVNDDYLVVTSQNPKVHGLSEMVENQLFNWN